MRSKLPSTWKGVLETMHEQLELPLSIPPRSSILALNSWSSGLPSIITWPLESITWLKTVRTMIYGMVLFYNHKYSSQNGTLSRDFNGLRTIKSILGADATFLFPEPTIFLTCGINLRTELKQLLSSSRPHQDLEYLMGLHYNVISSSLYTYSTSFTYS